MRRPRGPAWAAGPGVALVGLALIAGTAAAGALVHALAATPVCYVVAWSIPGVVMGGTVGTRAGKHVPQELTETVPGVVFGLVGLLVLGVELFA